MGAMRSWILTFFVVFCLLLLTPTVIDASILRSNSYPLVRRCGSSVLSRIPNGGALVDEEDDMLPNGIATVDKGRQLGIIERGVAGALAKAGAMVIAHPLFVIKVLLQSKVEKLPSLTVSLLTRGMISQIVLSLPHGAIAYVVTEVTISLVIQSRVDYDVDVFQVMRSLLYRVFAKGAEGGRGSAVIDFISSAIAATLCGVISVPQVARVHCRL